MGRLAGVSATLMLPVLVACGSAHPPPQLPLAALAQGSLGQRPAVVATESTAPVLQHRILKNGFEFVVAQDAGVNGVQLMWVGRGGGSAQGWCLAPRAQLLAQTLEVDFAEREAEQLGAGGRVRFMPSPDAMWVELASSSDALEAKLHALATLADHAPSAAAFQLGKRKQLARLSDLLSTGESFTRLALSRHFGPEHPLGTPVATVFHRTREASAEALGTCIRAALAPEHSALVVRGDVPDDAASLVASVFGALQPWGRPLGAPAAQPFATKQVAVLDSPRRGIHLLASHDAPALGAPDQVAFALLLEIIAGPVMSSRLFEELRRRQQVVYGADVKYSPTRSGAVWTVDTWVDNRELREVVDGLRRQLAEVRTLKLRQGEFEAARRRLRRRWTLDRRSASTLGQLLAHGLDPVRTIEVWLETLDGISQSDLQIAAARYSIAVYRPSARTRCQGR